MIESDLLAKHLQRQVWRLLGQGCITIACIVMLSATALIAQMPGQEDSGSNGSQEGGARGGRGMFGGQPPVIGTVTATTADHVTIKTEAGVVYQVYLSTNTRIMKERQPAKISDIQPGDMLTAGGEVDAASKTVHAAVAMDISAEQVKKMREGLGKQWIAGRVTAIEDTTLTVRRIDNVTQKIAVDESTSFRRGRRGMGGGMAAVPQQDANAAASGESITLADIKVGDNVTGRGGMKDGVFVPELLAVSSPALRGQRRSGGGAAGSDAAPAEAAKPQ